MRAKRAAPRIRRAIERVRENVRDRTDQGSLHSRGLSTEGYLGGYIAALNDVLLVLNGVPPNRPVGLDINPWSDDAD